jgi:peptide/nickel transport system substrate-binding protein
VSSRSRRTAFGALVVASALVAAACGGGSKKAAPTTTSTSADTGTSVQSDTATSVGAEGSTTTSTAAATGSVTTAKASTSSKTTKTTTRLVAPVPTKTAAVVQVTAPATTAPSEPPQPGGALTVLMNFEGHGFDPTLGTGSATVDSTRMFALYDALIYQDPPSGGVVPEIAQSFTTSDAKVWTLKIRPNIKFTDGTAYDADAVKFNWDRHADPANASPTVAGTLKTLSYQVVDPLTLRVTLNSANGQFPRIVSRQLSYIASPTAITKAGSQTAFNSNPVGAGPFTLKNWVRDSITVMVRNPSYWNAPKPYIDTLTFKVVVDESQRKSSMQAGEADVEDTQVAASASDLAKLYTVFPSPAVNTSTFLMNLTRPPFNDTNVRKAMQLAVDLDQINSTVYASFLEVPHGYFPPNYPYADPSLVFPNPDLTQAQKFVDAYVSQTGSDIQFNLEFTNSSENAALSQVMQAQLQRLNHVKVNIKLVTAAQIVTDFNGKSFDVLAFTYLGVDPEPEWIGFALSNGNRNVGYKNSTVDQAVLASQTATDNAVRIQALKDAQKQMIADVPFFPVHRQPLFWVSKANIRDVSTFDDGGLLTDRLWVKTHG